MKLYAPYFESYVTNEVNDEDFITMLMESFGKYELAEFIKDAIDAGVLTNEYLGLDSNGNAIK
jgi:hypothetical protein